MQIATTAVLWSHFKDNGEYHFDIRLILTILFTYSSAQPFLMRTHERKQKPNTDTERQSKHGQGTHFHSFILWEIGSIISK